MLCKSRYTGLWHEAGTVEWPTSGPGINHCLGDKCACCGEPKPTLYPRHTPDKFGRQSEERVCVGCLGTLNSKPRKPKTVRGPAPEPDTAARHLLFAGQPVPAGEYTITQITQICGRVRVTVHAEILKLKLGRLRQSMFRDPGQNHRAAGIGPRYRVLEAGEVEQLREHFQQRQKGRPKK